MRAWGALTARELIDALLTIPGDSMVTWTEWDSERDFTFVYGVRGVHESGALLYGDILESHDGLVDEGDET